MKRFIIGLMLLAGCGQKEAQSPQTTEPTALVAAQSSAALPVILGDADWDSAWSFQDMNPHLGYLAGGSFHKTPTFNVDSMIAFLLNIDCNCDRVTDLKDVNAALVFADSSGYGIDPLVGGFPECLPTPSAAAAKKAMTNYKRWLAAQKDDELNP